MHLFMTLEYHVGAENLFNIFKKTNQELEFITKKDAGLEDVNNYGTEFKSIGIIPTCMSKESLEALGWKERKQIWRKKRDADIRLWMDYERFIRETPENQRLMFIDIIIKSIQVIQEKSKEDFRGKELIEDILKALDVTKEQLANINQ